MPKDSRGGKRSKKNDFTSKKDIQTINNGIIPKGTKFTKVYVIAGKPRKKKVDKIDYLLNTYKGKEDEWTKRTATIQLEGKTTEVHYYQNDKIGKVDFKIKKVRGNEN